MARKGKSAIRSIADMKLMMRGLQVRLMSSNDSKSISTEHVYHEIGDQGMFLFIDSSIRLGAVIALTYFFTIKSYY